MTVKQNMSQGELLLSKSAVVDMMVQFCRENQVDVYEFVSRYTSQQQQQNENTCDLAAINERVKEGRWDLVLSDIEHFVRNESLALDLFEHIFRHLVHHGDLKSASLVLNNALVLGVVMKTKFPKRYTDLANVLARKDKAFLGGEEEMLSQRQVLATRLGDAISNTVATPLPSNALLGLLEDGMKYRHSGGEGHNANKRAKTELPSFQKFGKGVHVTCGTVVQSLIYVGTSDGFVETFASDTLQRQTAHDTPIFVDLSVFALAVSSSSHLVAVGDLAGTLHLFDQQQNKLVLKLHTGFPQVAQVVFCDTKVAVIGGSELCRIFSTKTGTQLGEFHAKHRINTLAYHAETGMLLLGLHANGHVTCWNLTDASWDVVTAAAVGDQGKVQRINGNVYSTSRALYQLSEDLKQTKLLSLAPNNNQSIEDFCIDEASDLLTVMLRGGSILQQFHINTQSWDAPRPLDTSSRFISIHALDHNHNNCVAMWGNRIAHV